MYVAPGSLVCFSLILKNVLLICPRQKVMHTESESQLALKQFSMMEEATIECRQHYESLIAKDKALAKRFKLEFLHTNASPAVIESLIKYFR